MTMMQDKYLLVLLVFGVLNLTLLVAPVSSQSDITLETPNPNAVDYILDGDGGYCQACLSFTLKSYDRGYFRLLYDQILEIDSSGNECCVLGAPGCTKGVGCDTHGYFDLKDVFTITSTNQTAEINGTYSTSGSTSPCVPPYTSSGYLCVGFDWTYEIVQNTTQMTFNNYNFTLYKNMLLIRLTISNWAFISSSQGLRVKLLWGTSDVSPEDFYLNPGMKKVDTDDLDLFANNYTSCEIKDFFGNEGTLIFSPVAQTSTGTYLNVTVTGPAEYDFDTARYFNIDIPKFTNSVTYYMGALVPQASGLGLASALKASWAMAGMILVPFIL